MINEIYKKILFLLINSGNANLEKLFDFLYFTIPIHISGDDVVHHLKLINNHTFDHILTFSRSNKHLGELLSIADAKGLNIKNLTDNIDYNDPKTNRKIFFEQSKLTSIFNLPNISLEDIKQAKILIESGINVNFTDARATYNSSPISALISNEAITLEDFNDLIYLMIKHGLQLNVGDCVSRYDYRTDLVVTYQQSHLATLLDSRDPKSIEKVMTLIDCGIDLGFRDENAPVSILPIFYDIVNRTNILAKDLDKLIGSMIKSGLDINSLPTQFMENTPLYSTFYKESYLETLLKSEFKETWEKAIILIKHGMDVNFMDLSMQSLYPSTPFSALINNKAISIDEFDSVISLMVKHGLKMNQTYAMSYMDYKTNAVVSYQQSYLIALFNSSETDDIEKVKVLIEHGFDINFIDPIAAPFKKSPYQLIYSKQDIMDSLYESIIYGHNTVILPKENDHKTKAAKLIYCFKFKEGALNKDILRAEGVRELFLDYISLSEYCPKILPQVLKLNVFGNNIEGASCLPDTLITLILGYTTIGDFTNWVRNGNIFSSLIMDFDTMELFEEEQIGLAQIAGESEPLIVTDDNTYVLI